MEENVDELTQCTLTAAKQHTSLPEDCACILENDCVKFGVFLQEVQSRTPLCADDKDRICG
jgi:hypothetical protein